VAEADVRSRLVSTAPEEITAVLASFDGARDARLRELMQALTRHLHAFALEVGLTQEEWAAAIETLVETGRMTQGGRNEFVLWSDTLGVSMLVDALANPKPPGATEPTILGPFWSPDAPLRDYGSAIFDDPPAGEPALGARSRARPRRRADRRGRARRLAERRRPALCRPARRGG
jgi:hypothetical protein